MGRTACTEPQCLYKGALYLLLFKMTSILLYAHICACQTECVVFRVTFSFPLMQSADSMIGCRVLLWPVTFAGGTCPSRAPTGSSQEAWNAKIKLFPFTPIRYGGGVDVQHRSFVTSVQDGSEWLTSRQGRSIPGVKPPQSPLNKRLSELRSWSDILEKK